ncbi:phosphotransferase [Sphingobium sp. AR-3-1]|uniref:Phosphotransferase n=1 Tax=Sphingobium psychrophilum TaxID=2728834 RepID=A0A7X9WTK0_9SPHN|nr:phosphotransferase [Sphingobium psychrophilum]NML09283.1 phosphotransferase [Sphingobium psychrophilum]
MADPLAHPTSAADITPAYLTRLMAQAVPGVTVTHVDMVEAKTYGEQFVSTAGRVIVNVRYGPGSPADLPTRLVVKVARGVDKILAPFYENEVNFYNRVRPELDLETPRSFGAGFDAVSSDFAIVLEDLTLRGATFPSVLSPVTLDTVRSILSQQAKLHARFWESPRLRPGGDLAWAGSHVEGKVAELMMVGAEPLIQHEIDTVSFKREMVQRLRTTGPALRNGTLALHRHQQSLPQTLVEGDMHIGNSYILPDGSGGLLDWQLTCRGHHMHDVSYLVTTALSVEDRRAHEQDLVRFYLDRLAVEGVTDGPSFEDSFTEFGRCLMWAVYIGWLTTPVVNYGWEINVMNHFRLTTAFEDHDTAGLIGQIA